MLHATHSKILVRPRRAIASDATPRTATRSPRAESIAAPLTLATVVLAGLALAAVSAIAGALGA